MALNLKKIQDALDRLEGKGRSGDSGIVKLPEGDDNVVRFVPYYHDPEIPFTEVYFHYDVGGEHFLCRRRHGNNACPICDFASAMWKDYDQTKDETYKKLFSKFAAKMKIFAPVVLRGQEDNGVKLLSMSEKTYKSILTKMKNALRQGIDITDPFEGLDVTIPVKKQQIGGFKWTGPDNDSIDVHMRPSKLFDDKSKEEVEEYLKNCPNVFEIFQIKSEDDMKIALEKQTSGSDSKEEDNETGTTKDFDKEELDLKVEDDKKESSSDSDEDLDAQFDRLLNSKEEDDQ